ACGLLFLTAASPIAAAPPALIAVEPSEVLLRGANRQQQLLVTGRAVWRRSRIQLSLLSGVQLSAISSHYWAEEQCHVHSAERPQRLPQRSPRRTGAGRTGIETPNTPCARGRAAGQGAHSGSGSRDVQEGT